MHTNVRIRGKTSDAQRQFRHCAEFNPHGSTSSQQDSLCPGMRWIGSRVCALAVSLRSRCSSPLEILVGIELVRLRTPPQIVGEKLQTRVIDRNEFESHVGRVSLTANRR